MKSTYLNDQHLLSQQLKPIADERETVANRPRQRSSMVLAIFLFSSPAWCKCGGATPSILWSEPRWSSQQRAISSGCFEIKNQKGSWSNVKVSSVGEGWIPTIFLKTEVTAPVALSRTPASLVKLKNKNTSLFRTDWVGLEGLKRQQPTEEDLKKIKKAVETIP